VRGENSGWPALDSYLFAETGPVWFGEVGSSDPDARRASAGLLLQVLDASEEKLIEGYGNTPIPKMRAHYAQAREQLESMRE
jgi:TolB protein